ncbi:transposase [Campylobacter lari]|uniref:Transposase n=1 Tax=Campylobacter lari TaxID=201 RepID=A0A5L4NBY7_CAMLA|nr:MULTISPECIES: transposase [Campylobacter]EAI3906151.1 transposase [Campylobacter lari]EAI3914746.1 transposase [Campylobacter lari]EAJ6153086.1 transposase [Campylobacter lari]EAJ6188571.1 transposase [Campylobacter lari]EAK0818969.1 transposase [Campylobacter lari]
MGFWDSVGKVAKDAAANLDAKSKELQATKIRLENKSSNELKNIINSEGFFSAGRTEKAMAVKILKERGEID